MLYWTSPHNHPACIQGPEDEEPLWIEGRVIIWRSPVVCSWAEDNRDHQLTVTLRCTQAMVCPPLIAVIENS
jgi:hypothetical protein